MLLKGKIENLNKEIDDLTNEITSSNRALNTIRYHKKTNIFIAILILFCSLLSGACSLLYPTSIFSSLNVLTLICGLIGEGIALHNISSLSKDIEITELNISDLTYVLSSKKKELINVENESLIESKEKDQPDPNINTLRYQFLLRKLILKNFRKYRKLASQNKLEEHLSQERISPKAISEIKKLCEMPISESLNILTRKKN